MSSSSVASGANGLLDDVNKAIVEELQQDVEVIDAWRSLAEHGYRHIPVVDGDVVRCQVQGSVEPLLNALANTGVRELLSREPSLEELFLSHYGAPADGAVNVDAH